VRLELFGPSGVTSTPALGATVAMAEACAAGPVGDECWNGSTTRVCWMQLVGLTAGVTCSGGASRGATSARSLAHACWTHEALGLEGTRPAASSWRKRRNADGPGA